MKNRITFILSLFAIFFTIIIARLYYLSIKSNSYYQELAKRNIINTKYLIPIRGEIKDIEGQKIATNKMGFSISIKPHLTKQQLNIDLQNIIKLFPKYSYEKLYKKYHKINSPYMHKPIKIIEFISYKEIIDKIVSLSLLRDITITAQTERFYPYKNIASHIIGYIAKANKKEIKTDKVARYTGLIGKSGIEKQYETILAGKLGKKKVKVTASNKEIATLSTINAISSDITLTIDMRLQKYIKSLFKNKTGAVIVLNVNDGSILAAGSYPEYNLNSFVKGIDQDSWNKMITDLDHPFTNKFTKGLYPPGSSIKPAVALSFLNSKLLDEDEIFFCEGELWLGRRKFRCWNHYGHGKVNLKRALSESCDIYFYKGGLRVGIDKISTDLKRYGFGSKTGIDLPYEFIGTVPCRNWKINKYGQSWYKGETLNTVIGQGNFLVTPIQIAQFTAMIASTKKVTPHFIKSINNKDVNYSSKIVFNKFELKKLQIIKEGMYDVCHDEKGTATKHISDCKIDIAGKTGTSQVIGIPQKEKERMSEDDLKYYQKSHAWFTTFGPYQNPKYAVTVLVEHGGHGGVAAGEIVSNIYNKLLELKYINQNYEKTTKVNQTKP